MTDLTAFLLARIAEDEAVAQAVNLSPDTRGRYQRSTNGGWPWVEYTPDAAKFYVMRVLRSGDDGYPKDAQDVPATAHFARHNPARVLAQCAALREVIEAAWADHVQIEGEWGSCQSREQMSAKNDNPDVLRALASIYADHPAFDPEWGLS